ncbi:MAG TPA: metallophosphoesterase [Herpetosiphonaceae bacterium]
MIDQELITDRPPARAEHEPRFGWRIPTDGKPASFRVLINLRWLWAACLAALGLLAALSRIPRGRRLPLLLAGGVIPGAAALIVAVAQARQLIFERITVPVAGLPPALDGFTIVQLSDFHLGAAFTVANLRRAVAWTRQRQADLVVLTGDFVNDSHDVPLLHECLQGIEARYGVYAILGNHDYWTNSGAVERALTDHGIELLRNERRRIDIGGASLYLVGVDCVWEDQHDLELALSRIPVDATVVVLAHEPDIADEIAPYGPALQLSGHTHAGHFAVPLLGPLFLPRHGFRYFRGLQRVGPMWLYVSRGLGGLPFRLGCPPEATELTLRAARDE